MSTDDGDESDDCCVCGIPDWSDQNVFIYCDLCSTATHQQCYDVDTVPSGDWYCQPCKYIIACFDKYVDENPGKPPYPMILPCCVMCQSVSTAVLDQSHIHYNAKNSPKYTYKPPPLDSSSSSTKSTWWRGEENPVVSNLQTSAPRVPNLFSLLSPLQLASMLKLSVNQSVDLSYPAVQSSAWNAIRPAKLSKALYPASNGESILNFFKDANYKRIIDYLSTNIQLSRYKKICQPTPENWGLTLGSLVPQYMSRGDVRALTSDFGTNESALLQNTLPSLPCWIHSTCSIWVPGLTLDDGFATGISNVEQDRRRLTCTVCNTRGGAVQCDWSNCLVAFHPYCGIKGGLQVSMEPKGNAFKYTYRCHQHRTDEFVTRKKDQYLGYWTDTKKASILSSTKKKSRNKRFDASSSSDDTKANSKRSKNMIVTPSPFTGFVDATPQNSTFVAEEAETPVQSEVEEVRDSGVFDPSVQAIPAMQMKEKTESIEQRPIEMMGAVDQSSEVIMSMNDKPPLEIVNETGHYSLNKSVKLLLHDEEEQALKMLLDYKEIRYDYGDQSSHLNLSRYYQSPVESLTLPTTTLEPAHQLQGSSGKIKFVVDGQSFPTEDSITEYNANLHTYKTFLKEEWKENQSKYHYDVYTDPPVESNTGSTKPGTFKPKRQSSLKEGKGENHGKLRAQMSKVGANAQKRFGCGLRMLGSNSNKFIWQGRIYKRMYNIDSVTLVPESSTHGVRIKLHGCKKLKSESDESGAETSDIDSYLETFDSDFAEFSECESVHTSVQQEDDIWKDGLELFVAGQNEDTTVLDVDEEKKVLKECFVSLSGDLNLQNPPTEERDDADFSETITSEKQLWPRVNTEFFFPDNMLRDALSGVRSLHKNLVVDTHLLDVMLEAPKRGRPVRRPYVTEVIQAAVKRFSLFLEVTNESLPSSQQQSQGTMKRTKKVELKAPEGVLTKILPPVVDDFSLFGEESVYSSELAQRAWNYKSPQTDRDNLWKLDRQILLDNASHSNIPMDTQHCWNQPQFSPGVLVGHQNKLFPVYTRCHHQNPRYTSLRGGAQSMYSSCDKCLNEKFTLRAFRNLVDAALPLRYPYGMHITTSSVATTPSSKFLILSVHSVALSSMLGTYYAGIKRKQESVPFTLTSNNEPAVGFTPGTMLTPKNGSLEDFDDTSNIKFKADVKRIVASHGISHVLTDTHNDQIVLYDEMKLSNTSTNNFKTDSNSNNTIHETPVIDPITLEILSLQTQLDVSKTFVKRIMEKLENIVEEKESEYDNNTLKTVQNEQAQRQYRKERAMWRAAAAIEKRRLQTESSMTDDNLGASLTADHGVPADGSVSSMSDVTISNIEVHQSVLDKRMERADAHRSTLVSISSKLKRCNVCNEGGLSVYQYFTKYQNMARSHISAVQNGGGRSTEKPSAIVAVAVDQLPKALLPFRLILGSTKRPAPFSLFYSNSMGTLEDSSNNYNMEIWGQLCLFICQLQQNLSSSNNASSASLEILPYDENIFSMLKQGPVVSCTTCSVSVHANCYEIEEPLWCPNIVTFAEALSIFYALQIRKLAQANKQFSSLIDTIQHADVPKGMNIFELLYTHQSSTMFIHADAMIHAFMEAMSLLQGEGVFQHRFKYNTPEENAWESKARHWLGCSRKNETPSTVPSIGIETQLRQECAFNCAWKRDDQVHAMSRVKAVLSSAMFTPILCNYCELVSDANADESIELPKSNVCVCCHVSGGALKLTEENQLVHSSCSTLLPELFYSGDLIAGVEECLKTRKSLTCYLCAQKIGACIQCNHKLCYTAFHVSCGYQAGLTVSKETEGATTKTVMFCDRHSHTKTRIQRFQSGDLQKRRKGIRFGYYPMPSVYTNTSTLSMHQNSITLTAMEMTHSNHLNNTELMGIYKRRGRPPKNGGFVSGTASNNNSNTNSMLPVLKASTSQNTNHAKLGSANVWEHKKQDQQQVKKRGRPPKTASDKAAIDDQEDLDYTLRSPYKPALYAQSMSSTIHPMSNIPVNTNTSNPIDEKKGGTWSIRGILDFFRSSTDEKNKPQNKQNTPPKKRKILDSDSETEIDTSKPEKHKKRVKPAKTSSFNISEDSVVVPLTTSIRVHDVISAIEYDDRSACYCTAEYNDSVECTGCLMWFHYPCAGIIDKETIEQVENDAWKCCLCLTGTFYKKQHRFFVQQLLDEDFSSDK